MRRQLRGFFLFLAFSAFSMSLNAAETMGRYESSRGNRPTFFETAAWTYTEPHKIDIQITFGKSDIKKEKGDSADLYQFSFCLDRQQYEQIFENMTPVKDLLIQGNINNSRITTQINGEERKVVIDFSNSLDSEITSVFKKGRLEISMLKGQITSMKMTKEKKRFLNMGGFTTCFIGEANDIKRVKSGLGLFDEGEIGRLRKAENIDRALGQKNLKNFQEMLQLESR
jgi:hypothetical protein